MGVGSGKGLCPTPEIILNCGGANVPSSMH